MKKIKFIGLSAVLGIGLVLFGSSKVEANDYTVTLSTINPTSTASTYSAGGYPNIANNLNLRKLVLSNGGATAQIVTVYDTCTSSSAASVAMIVDLPAAIGVVGIPDGDNFLPNVFNLGNPCIKKSATGSAVNATLFYE